MRRPLLVLAGALAAGVVATSAVLVDRQLSAGDGPEGTAAPEIAAEPPAFPVGPRPFVGVDLGSGFYDASAVTAFEELIDRRVAVVQAFVSWAYVEDEDWNRLNGHRVQEILDLGAIPEITWAPQISGSGPDQPSLRLSTIAAGEHDDYIATFARAVEALGEPVMIRFGHEMNNPASPFAETANGNQRGDYRAAFRHVHDTFDALGAYNVSWVWAPNILLPDAESLERYYPGDDYVDWVGVDGYSYPRAGCDSPSEVFDATLADVQSFTAKPLMLSEVAVAEECPDKARWIEDFVAWLDERPEVLGFIWWHRTTEGLDYRLDSSPAALTAFRGSL